jgi:hypothetical protein
LIDFCIHLINYHRLLLLITLWTPLPVEVVEDTDADAPPEVDTAAAADDAMVMLIIFVTRHLLLSNQII